MKNLVPTVIIFLLWVNVRAQSFSEPNFSVSNIVTGLTEPVGRGILQRWRETIYLGESWSIICL
jgi:hypothetical protein